MPRIEFASAMQFSIWRKERTKPERHDMYVTAASEFIMVPRKSTDPILYGYFPGSDTLRDDLIKELEAAGYMVFIIEKFAWSAAFPLKTVGR